MLLTALVVFPALYCLLINPNLYVSSVNSIFGTINNAALVGLTSSFALLPFGLFIELGIYRNYKHLLKKEKGIKYRYGISYQYTYLIYPGQLPVEA